MPEFPVKVTCMLPNFMVVGAQKAGTTSLHHYLKGHPDIYLPEQKESKFFVFDDRFEKGIKSYERQYFGGWSGERAVGEVDPDYMYFDIALERMVETLDVENMKFIFVLRDPVRRAFSHYLMTYRRGLESLDFEEALEAEPERISRDTMSNMHYSYAARGYYSVQIKRFMQYVDPAQVLFVLSEDLHQRTSDSLRTIYQFLGVKDDLLPASQEKKFHSATVPKNMGLLRKIEGGDSWEKKLLRCIIPWKKGREKLRSALLKWNQTGRRVPELADEVYKRLSLRYEQEYKDLAELTGLDLSCWYSQSQG